MIAVIAPKEAVTRIRVTGLVVKGSAVTGRHNEGAIRRRSCGKKFGGKLGVLVDSVLTEIRACEQLPLIRLSRERPGRTSSDRLRPFICSGLMEPRDRFVGSLTCKNGQPAASERALLRNSMAEEFACPKCSSQSVVYPDVPADDEYVTCRACGTILATVSQFRQFVECHLVPSGAPFSGC